MATRKLIWPHDKHNFCTLNVFSYLHTIQPLDAEEPCTVLLHEDAKNSSKLFFNSNYITFSTFFQIYEFYLDFSIRS